ncbi:MAG: hypothetical protein FJW80_07825 [Actinobacteria bacterium]|nr:hypothetical protein [Actinomycetota bacterium]
MTVVASACIAGGLATSSQAAPPPQRAAAQSTAASVPVSVDATPTRVGEGPPAPGPSNGRKFLGFVIGSGADMLFDCLVSKATGGSCLDPSGMNAIKAQLDTIQKEVEQGFIDVEARLNRIEEQINDLQKEKYLSRLDPLRQNSAMAVAAFSNMTDCAAKQAAALDKSKVTCKPYLNGPLDDSGVPEQLGASRPADEAIAITRGFFLKNADAATPEGLAPDDVAGAVKILIGDNSREATKGYLYYAWQGIKIDMDEAMGTPQGFRKSVKTPVVLPQSARDFNSVLDFWDETYSRWAIVKIAAARMRQGGTAASQKLVADQMEQWLITPTGQTLPSLVTKNRFPDMKPDELIVYLGKDKDSDKTVVVNWSGSYDDTLRGQYARMNSGDVSAIAKSVNAYLREGGSGGIEDLATKVPGVLPDRTEFQALVSYSEGTFKLPPWARMWPVDWYHPSPGTVEFKYLNSGWERNCVSGVRALNARPDWPVWVEKVNPYNRQDLEKIWNEQAKGPIDFFWGTLRFDDVNSPRAGIYRLGFGAYIRCTDPINNATRPSAMRSVPAPQIMMPASAIKPRPGRPGRA